MYWYVYLYVVMTTEDMDAPWSKKSEVSVFDEIDIDELLAQLTPEEIEALENETDPDVSHCLLSTGCGRFIMC